MDPAQRGRSSLGDDCRSFRYYGVFLLNVVGSMANKNFSDEEKKKLLKSATAANFTEMQSFHTVIIISFIL